MPQNTESPYPSGQSGQWPDYPPPPPGVPASPYPPPPGYGAPAYGYAYPPAPGYYPGPMAPTTNGYATASLVCSLVGIFVPILASVLAIFFGVVALNQIGSSNGRYEGRGLAIAGIVIGAVGVVLGICVVGAIIVALNDPNLANPASGG